MGVGEVVDEGRAEVVVGWGLWVLRERDVGFARVRSGFDGAADGPERYRTFHRLLAAVMAEWIGGEVEANGLMRWVEFRDGVRGALRDIMARDGRGRRVGVFSSGGPMGVGVQSVVGAADLMGGGATWRVVNCSVTGVMCGWDLVALGWLIGGGVLVGYRGGWGGIGM